MATMTVSLPESMSDWIDRSVRTGEYASSTGYVRNLVRDDRERKTKLAALQKAIDEAEASGIGPRSVDEVFAEAQRQALGG